MGNFVFIQWIFVKKKKKLLCARDHAQASIRTWGRQKKPFELVIRGVQGHQGSALRTPCVFDAGERRPWKLSPAGIYREQSGSVIPGSDVCDLKL